MSKHLWENKIESFNLLRQLDNFLTSVVTSIILKANVRFWIQNRLFLKTPIVHLRQRHESQWLRLCVFKGIYPIEEFQNRES